MNSAVLGGQFWASEEAKTYFVAGVYFDLAFLVPVRIEGQGSGAKVIGDGKVRRVQVREILDTWMPVGKPIDPIRTWHEHLLDRLDEP
jgi:hypothetical protein